MTPIREAPSNKPTKQLEIGRELVALDAKIQGLQARINGLAERIADILRPSAPRVETETEQEYTVTTIGSRLRECTTAIGNATSEIDDIIDRCELCGEKIIEGMVNLRDS